MKKVFGWVLAGVIGSGIAGAAEPKPAATAPVAAAAVSDVAKQVIARDSAAVVSMRIVITSRAGGGAPAQEMELEALGVVLDSSGLIVSSYSSVDPANAMAKEAEKQDTGREVKSSKIIMQDGTEQPLKIVLRDADLDLIFLRPEKPLNLPHVDLKRTAAAMAAADPIIVLSRLGAVGNRQESVMLNSVRSVVTKPRRLYVSETSSIIVALGCPVYDGSGLLAGLIVIRTSEAALSRVTGGIETQMMAAVLPIADVVSDMEQVDKQPEKPAEKATAPAGAAAAEKAPAAAPAKP